MLLLSQRKLAGRRVSSRFETLVTLEMLLPA